MHILLHIIFFNFIFLYSSISREQYVKKHPCSMKKKNSDEKSILLRVLIAKFFIKIYSIKRIIESLVLCDKSLVYCKRGKPYLLFVYKFYGSNTRNKLAQLLVL